MLLYNNSTRFLGLRIKSDRFLELFFLPVTVVAFDVMKENQRQTVWILGVDCRVAAEDMHEI